MGFLGFASTSFDVLAWPLISLGYPLYASIRAIEVKSNSDMQKLITYWILFSLISLSELGLSKLIEWLPFWPYIKLMAISFLVLPHFEGAYHVYACVVRPYCLVNPEEVINKFNKLKELSHKGENFLAMAEKYLEENGSEALEKLITSKSKGVKSSYDVEEIKTVANTEKKEVVAAIESSCKGPIVVQKDIKAVEQTEINAAAAAKPKCKDPIVVQKDIKAVEQTEENAAAAAKHIWPMKNNTGNLQDLSWNPKTESKGKVPITVQKDIKAVEQTEINAAAAAKRQCKDPIVVQKDIKAVDQTEKNAAAAAKHIWPMKNNTGNLQDLIWKPKTEKDIKAVEQTEVNAAAATKVKNGGQNLAHAEKKTDATLEVKDTTATSVAGRENKLPEVTTSKNIQKEWTCAVCQLKTTSEKDLNSHLQGWRHWAKCEELKASKSTDKNKGSWSSTENKSHQANQEPGKRKWSQVDSYKERNPKNAGNTQMQPSKLWCSICNVRCSGKIDMACHLKGRKHLTRVQEVFGCAGGEQGWEETLDSGFGCAGGEQGWY
ncbi:uncharacterized protein LOC132294217 isoform X2 [Cornus florida]|uniref:uncharacterized protein LOC132294217 isoform X2 n=1 Tax=Cornus florida TaxID=4283 RepID=UPI00289AD8A5|nr:uncharacterized protein LOC132294217 isoform X2 [Cornus florida]